MKARAAAALLALLGLAGLMAGCGEKPQTNAEGVKHDTPPYGGTSTGTGTGNAAQAGTVFTAPGWKVGDKATWEEHMKTRAQNGMNEYNRIR